jgi:general secretion pathway protein C
MRTLRALLTAAVPAGIALVAFLNARAVSALVEGTVSGGMGIAEANANANAKSADANANAKSADAILDRNPFDHVTGPLRVREQGPGDPPDLDTDPRTAPLCQGVKPLVVVGDEDQKVAFASLEVGGARVLRRRGGDVGGKRVAYVGRDRIWLEGPTGLCQALLFGAPPPVTAEGNRSTADPSAPRSALEIEVAKHIVKTGPNEYQIDRPTVDRILEAQAELMKARIIPEKEGDRIVGMKVLGIKPGSVLALIGIENGDRLETINGFEVSNPERMLEAYARLRFADRLTVHLTRGGKPINLDYTIR